MSTSSGAPALHSPRSLSGVGNGEDNIYTTVLIAFTDVREVDRDTLEPILFLLQNPDIEVQRAASAALGNLAVNSKSFLATCLPVVSH